MKADRLDQLRDELKAGVLPDRGTVLGLVLATEAALAWHDSHSPCLNRCGRQVAGLVPSSLRCNLDAGERCWIADRLDLAAARFEAAVDGGSRQPAEATAGVLLGLLWRRLTGRS